MDKWWVTRLIDAAIAFVLEKLLGFGAAAVIAVIGAFAAYQHPAFFYSFFGAAIALTAVFSIVLVVALKRTRKERTNLPHIQTVHNPLGELIKTIENAVTIERARHRAPSTTDIKDGPKISQTSSELIQVIEPSVIEGGFALMTPREIREIYKTHNTHEAERLLNPIIGQQYGVRGIVNDVNIKQGSNKVTLKHTAGEHSLIGHFSDKWTQHLMLLNKGSRAAFAGKISRIDGLFIILDECELIPHNRIKDH